MIETTSLIRFKGFTPGVAKREWPKMTKPVWSTLGVHWHRRMRPKHFSHAGANQYNYQRRGAKYLKRKLRLFGHTLPLVFSGESRALTRIRDVRATSKGVRVVMRANTLNFRASPTAPNMAAELRRVTPSENEELTRLFDRGIDTQIKSNRSASTMKVRA